MSPKQWLALFCFYISYLFFGASVFYHIEHGLEAKRRAIDLQHRIDINEILVKYVSPNDTQIQDEILRRVSVYCNKPVTNYTLDTYVEPLKWSFYHAFFFSFTVCSTVGYGNISPSNTVGRMFMIFYALIGIPVNGFLFAYLGDFFGKAFLGAYERYKAYKMATTKNYAPQRLGLIAQILLYLIPGIVIFLFLPSLIFSYFENWSYTVSLYYSFVTLTTIGFGDYVPTFDPNQEQDFGFMFHVYEVFIIFWFIFGLGYLVMIMGFIAKGLRSKHLTRLEHQLADNIKATQSRIWNGVTKDVGYLRRILNEVYIMKFKSVYSDGEEGDDLSHGRRSSSCPDLTIYRPASDPAHRKRAQSLFNTQNYAEMMSSSAMHRGHSDGDLNQVDRQPTFDQLSPSSELLARVVTALGNIRAAEDDAQSILDMGIMAGAGVHGFSDSQILASERMDESRGSLAFSDGSYVMPPTNRRRTRAASEFRAPATNELNAEPDEHKWTWNGTNSQIQEFLRLRQMNKRKPNNLYRASFALPKTGDSVLVNIEPPSEFVSPAASNSPSLFSRWNPFKKLITDTAKQSDKLDIDSYLDHSAAGRHSRISLSPNQYLSSTSRGRTSNFSILSMNDDSNADVLEKTTIADLIRALEVIHTKAQAPDAPLLHDLFDTPKRKLGTAGLSPPSSSAAPPLINVHPPVTEMNRRNSVHMFSANHTPVFNRARMARRQSNILDGRRASFLRPPSDTAGQPPPYSESTPKMPHRRFSVRPTMLSIPPGQAPLPKASSMLQRKLSMRPSPLASEANSARASGRYNRSISMGTGVAASAQGTPAARRRNPPHLLPLDEGLTAQTRRSSQSPTPEAKEHRRRSESK